MTPAEAQVLHDANLDDVEAALAAATFGDGELAHERITAVLERGEPFISLAIHGWTAAYLAATAPLSSSAMHEIAPLLASEAGILDACGHVSEAGRRVVFYVFEQSRGHATCCGLAVAAARLDGSIDDMAHILVRLAGAAIRWNLDHKEARRG